MVNVKNISLSLIILILYVMFVNLLALDSLQVNQIKNLIQNFKKDERGPYQAIRWFCPDGTVLPPDQQCLQPGGIQHAIPKDIVKELATERGIYLGQILAGTPLEIFRDAENQYSRLIQYQLEKFLQQVDDGWISRRSRFYRGAIQAEDEENWGYDFLLYLLTDDKFIQSQYFLIRQTVKTIPHRAGDNLLQNIRSLSKTISDSLPGFLDIRIKIHGQPESSDLDRVQDFIKKNKNNITSSQQKMLQQLLDELIIVYQSPELKVLNSLIKKLPLDFALVQSLNNFITEYQTKENFIKKDSGNIQSKLYYLAKLLIQIRNEITHFPKASHRLILCDISNEIESVIFREASNWPVYTIRNHLDLNLTLTYSLVGTGFLELWEWYKVNGFLEYPVERDHLSIGELMVRAEYSRRVVEWGTNMVKAVYSPVINLYTEFEPKAAGFSDDIIRSSMLMPLGSSAGRLAGLIAKLNETSNVIFDDQQRSFFQGLNPGFAVGELEVMKDINIDMNFASQKIYALQRVPAEIKPVAGIMTVSEGNLVSHVQLLAKNLGIPNALISDRSIETLLPYNGQKIFFAVSPGGRVVLKKYSEMSGEEKNLITNRQLREEKIAVPLDKMNLRKRSLTELRLLRASDSGTICGPKAANLGELKHMFPDKVVDGFIIPFGVFREHLDQKLPGLPISYWDYLMQIFAKAEENRNRGISESVIEQEILDRLKLLREEISKIPLLPEFRKNLRHQFTQVFGFDLGKTPVFIRSDTNMEDLKDFTGAGLNLTVFNVLDSSKILQGIRDVWASPYSERSYRWRQKFLLNPENVYPSILIIPTVNVDKSGVLITYGLSSKKQSDLTLAFNRGAAGAVEGQVAESYLLTGNNEYILLHPAREPQYTFLPSNGGIVKKWTTFEEPILTETELSQIKKLAQTIEKKMWQGDSQTKPIPLDIELGIKDNSIWLFQVRPYVENKKASSVYYLNSLDPEIDNSRLVHIDTVIQN